MPKSLVDTPLSAPAGYTFGRLSLGVVWGGVAGAMIGASISMTIGLFYSSATALIFAVITVSGMLGAVFGQVMSNLLTDDLALTGRASGSHHAFHDVHNAGPGTDLCDHKALKEEQQTKIIPNQEVMAKINTMRSGSASLPPYRPDAQVFELIVSAAHKTDASGARAGREFKTLS